MAMTLEPCPFCGTADMDTCNPDGVFPDGGPHGYFVARCGNPDCAAEVSKQGREETIAAWNRRAHLTQPAQAVDVGAIREVIAWMEDNACGEVAGITAQIDKLTRALAGEKAEGWRDIGSAPKDGTCVVLAWNENGEWEVIPGAFKTNRDPARSGWVAAAMDYEYLNGGTGLRFCDFAVAPTHWQPLHTPPTDGEE